MADFYIERAFATLSAADERALSRRLESSARAYPVRWRACLVDAEHRRIVCRLEAANLKAARAAARCVGLGPEAIWLCAMPIAAATTAGAEPTAAGGDASCGWERHSGRGADSRPQTGLVDVLAECRVDSPIDVLRFVRGQSACDWCLEAWRVESGPVAASADGRRLVVFFRAPDAQAVRNACRHATPRFDRIVALRRIAVPVAACTDSQAVTR